MNNQYNNGKDPSRPKRVKLNRREYDDNSNIGPVAIWFIIIVAIISLIVTK